MKKLQLIIALFLMLGTVQAQVTAEFTASATTANVGDAIEFTDQSSSNGTITSYLWEFGDGNTGLQETSTHIYTAAANYTVCLTVQDDLGQTDMICKTDYITIVNPVPVVNIAPPSILTCNSSSVTLNSDASVTGSNPTFLWTTADGLILFNSENTQNPIVGLAGIYTLQITNSTGTGSGTVTVTSDAEFPDIIIQAPALLSCTNSMVTLDATGSSPSPDFTYEWSVGNTVLSNDVTVDVSAAGVYTLKVANANMAWCDLEKTVEVFSDNTVPAINLPVTALNDTIYQCQEVVHYSEALVDASCVNCSIEIRDGNNNLLSNSLPFDMAPSFFPISPFVLTVTDNDSGCSNSTILPNPPSSNMFIGLSITDASCLGTADGAIDLNVSGTNSPFIYDWADVAGTDNDLDRENLVAGIYTLSIIDVLGCVSVETYEIESDPVISVGPDLVLGCNSTTVTPTLSGPIAAIYTNEWTDLNGNVIPMSGPAVFDSPGTYIWTVTNISTLCSTSDTLVVTEDIGVPVANAGGNQILYCGETLVTLSGWESSSGGDFSYQWTTSNGTILSGETTLNPQVSSAGVYELVVADNTNGCVASSSVEVLEEDTPLVGFTINQCSGGVEFIFCQTCSITVTDAMGGVYTCSASVFPCMLDDFIDASLSPFEVTVVGPSGCETTQSINVFAPPNLLQVTAVVTNLSSAGASDGSIDITVTGGQPPYNYSWSNGVSVEDLLFLSIGSYAVTVTDNSGCVVVETYEIGEITMPSNVTICQGDVFQTTITTTGNYSFLWTPNLNVSDPTILNPVFSPTETTTYTLVVTDAGTGTSVFTDDFTIEVSNYLDFGLLEFSNTPLCDGDDLELYANAGVAFSWTGPNGYVSNGENPILTGATSNLSGEYTVTITDQSGCTAVGSSDVFIDDDCVWAGDTDTNKVVNHFDLLNIGLAYDSTGSIRHNASLDWIGQPSFDWPQSTPNTNVNYKHIDTDGNGIINAADTMAITQNNGLTHNFSGTVVLNQFGNLPPASDGVTLVSPFYVEPDTLIEGETIGLDIILGDMSNMVTGLYGIAFSIEYDSSIVVDGSAKIDFSDCWLGDISADAISIQFDYPNPGRIDAAITRIDGEEMDGAGLFGTFIITLEDDILLWDPNGGSTNFTATTTTDVTADFRITNYHLINFSEEEILVDAMTTTAVVGGTTALDYLELDKLIEIYPNPANELFYIFAKDLNIENVRIYSATGQLQSMKTKTAHSLEFSTKELPNGVYFIEIQTGEGVITKKLSVMK